MIGIGKKGPDICVDFDRVTFPIDGWAIGLFSSFEPVDVLINNAGVTEIDFIEDHGSDRFASVLQTNLLIPYALSRQFVIFSQGRQPPPSKDGGEAIFRIINTASMAVKMSMRGSPGYCAAKAGLEALGRQMAKEFAGRFPIGVFTVSPGTIEQTWMSEYVIKEMARSRCMTEEAARKYAMQCPLGRAATHDEVWRLFDFCVNRAPLYCSGASFYMPGGMGI